MKKIALLTQKKESGWTSCRSITRNLIQSWRLAWPKAEFGFFSFDESMSPFEVEMEAAKIRGFSPSLLVLVDHWPHPAPLLHAISGPKKEKLPPITIQVFGDFILNPNDWLSVEPLLAATTTRFICASERQRKVVQSLTGLPEQAIGWIPFPVDVRDFHPDRARRTEIRRTRGISARDHVFLYTGRLSLQKNVLPLLECFQKYLKNINPRTHLWLAGEVDDLAQPYLGHYRYPTGYFSLRILQRIGELFPGPLARQVHYFGNLQYEQLRGICSAADSFISLSTHNDEDYGMSPAEAACCGLPLTLTDWGGYASFQSLLPDSCSLVEVLARPHRIEPDPVHALRRMIVGSSKTLSAPRQQSIAREAHRRLSCESAAKKLRVFHSRPLPSSHQFRTFTELHRRVSLAFRQQPHAPFALKGHFSPLYKEVYHAYTRPEASKN